MRTPWRAFATARLRASELEPPARVRFTMNAPDNFEFFQRTFPSANMVLVKGERPVLFDSGFGSDFEETRFLLDESGVPPDDLTLIVNSHFHCDHAGGNHSFQRRYGTPVAAHRWDAGMVNRRDSEACTAEWLQQPIESYRVNRPLSEGDRIETRGVLLEVVETPGHSLGHISLYAPQERVLLAGDIFHEDDVAWINPFREGVGGIMRAIESLEKLANLKIAWSSTGHGPPPQRPKEAIASAIERYERWLDSPESAAWHGAKRIFAYALMLSNGMEEMEARTHLSSAPWFRDYATHAFRTTPDEFIRTFLDEMTRSGAAEWQDGRLMPLAPFNPPPPGWPGAPSRPAEWE